MEPREVQGNDKTYLGPQLLELNLQLQEITHRDLGAPLIALAEDFEERSTESKCFRRPDQQRRHGVGVFLRPGVNLKAVVCVFVHRDVVVRLVYHVWVSAAWQLPALSQ